MLLKPLGAVEYSGHIMSTSFATPTLRVETEGVIPCKLFQTQSPVSTKGSEKE